MNGDVVGAQLQATVAATEAAALNARLALVMYQGLTPELDIPLASDEPTLDDTDCPHLQREDANVMNPNGETREYCKACRHYLYVDGRAEAAS